MLNLKKTLSKLGEARLTDWLGSSTVELLDALNLGSPSPSSLAELVIDRTSAASLLLNKQYRVKIFNALKENEAQELCNKLGAESETPWSSLEKISFSKKSKSYRILLDAFSIEYPEEHEANNDNSAPTVLIKPEYPLFQHQIAASRKALSILMGKHGRAILHMPTGAGKTRTAMNIISDLLRQKLPTDSVIVWLAHSEELCEQAAAEFQNAWFNLGSFEFPVHRHFGQNRVDSLDEIQSGFVVMSLSLAYQTSFRDDEAFFALAKKTKFVVMDEAHQAVAETYQHVLNILAPNTNVALLGLTATPGRSWLDVGEDLKLANFFERQKVSLKVEGYDNPIDYLRAEGYLSEVITEPIYYKGSYGKITESELQNIAIGLDISPAALKIISEDSARNLLIIKRIIEEYQADNKIIVFACSVEHAEIIATILKLKKINAAAITGKTAGAVRRDSIDKFKNSNDLNILISCDVLTTGFDAPKANVAIIARPTESLVLYSQMVGRVVRGWRANGTDQCKVITVVDQVFGFRDLAESFIFWDDLWD